MLWYNNPDAVAAVHRAAMEERYEARRRRSLLRVVGDTGPDARY